MVFLAAEGISRNTKKHPLRDDVGGLRQMEPQGDTPIAARARIGTRREGSGPVELPTVHCSAAELGRKR